jgi:phosphoribosyl-ATP pyrophosphohydrolase/phosphoribosyl-AMP cyclohydrolase
MSSSTAEANSGYGRKARLPGISWSSTRFTPTAIATPCSSPPAPVCHEGTATCFGSEPLTRGEHLAFLSSLESVIEKRVAESPKGSYTARLFSEGPKRIAQKVGEEGLEVALAAVAETDDKVLSESADLIFHLLVLLRSRGLSFQGVVAELQSRHATKG